MILFLFILSCIYITLSGLNWAATLVCLLGYTTARLKIHPVRILLDIGMLAYFIWYLIK